MIYRYTNFFFKVSSCYYFLIIIRKRLPCEIGKWLLSLHENWSELERSEIAGVREAGKLGRKKVTTLSDDDVELRN